MKVALLTIWHVRNYGAEMQTYATVRILQQLGHDVRVVNLYLSDMQKHTLKRLLHDSLMSFTIAEFKFRHFWKKYIPVTKRYRSVAALQSDPPRADMYLVGSDQVWNPSITKDFAPLYFLNFGPKNVIRASYASSIGTTRWIADNDLTKLVKTQLSHFKQISCRENTATEIIRNAFGKTAQVVLDPTLMLASYPELTGNIKKNPVLVYYALVPDYNLELFAKHVAVELKLEFVDINESKRMIRNIVWNRLSVERWLSYIAGANFVITQSFHGLSFSLLYHKQFIVVVSNQLSDRSSRITDLLKELGLENRCFYSISDALSSGIWMCNIDYDRVESRLSELRKKSYLYFQELFNEYSIS